MKDTKTPPPYTNRWGTTPGPDFRRCQGDTKKGEQCRRAAEKGRDRCQAHTAEH